MAKVACPRAAYNILDRAIQAHGGGGVAQDTILPELWKRTRTLRIAEYVFI